MEFFKSKKVVLFAIIVWVVIIMTISYWKYVNLLFNGFDLAIYNQAMFNTVSGHPMNVSIHPHNYFGDHFEPILFLITPLYYLFSHPLTLIVIQTLVIGLTAYAIYLISNLKLSHNWSVLLSLAWLFNPFINSGALFEFHALILGYCALVWSVYFYLTNKYWAWLLLILLTLLSREDLSLCVIAFGLIGLVDKRSPRWFLPPLIGGLLWYLGAMKMISFFAPDNHYKFLYYYKWLGSSLSEIFFNVFKKPWLVVVKLFQFENLLLVLTLLMPTLFVAVKKPKWFLLALPPFLAYSLTGSNNISVVFVSHYGFALVPGFILASIDSIANLTNTTRKSWLTNNLLFILVVVAVVYSATTLGLGKTIYDIFNERVVDQTKTQFTMLAPEKSIVSAFGSLANYSNRENIFSLHYLLTGHKQLSTEPFKIPLTDYIVLDRADMVHFSAFSPNTEFWKKWWPSMPVNLRDRLKNYSLISLTDQAIFSAEKTNGPLLVEKNETPEQTVSSSEPVLTLVSELPANNLTQSDYTLYLLTIHCSQASTNNKIIEITQIDAKNKVKTLHYPYLWGLWRANECEKNTSYKQLIAVPKATNLKMVKFDLINVNLQTKINGAGVLTFSINDPRVFSSYLIDKN